ncbi:MAG: sulfatase-like hydrolase/transferase, partial [Deltaproteobacteria bacterium]|nr:sulfatase-like hydrolase/transferase [Deltaproteobacteria bacterium]
MPNVLFILADDVNDWVGCIGRHPGARTPNIDSFAEQGVLFQRAYCNAPLCNPSRTSLLTGLRPSTTGVYGNSHLLRPDAETLPQLFRKHGYHTIGVGKVFHWEDVGTWDEIVKVEGKNPTPAKRPVNGISDARHFDWATLDVKDDEMRDGKFANRIIKIFQKNHQKPFFLAWGIGANHLPYYVPQKYFDLYPLEGITLPEVKPDDLDDVPPIGRLLADTEGKFWWSVHGGDHRAVTAHGQWERAV